MQRALGLGYQSTWARAHLPTRRERNAFYAVLGRSIAPGSDGLSQLASVPDAARRTPKELLAAL